MERIAKIILELYKCGEGDVGWRCEEKGAENMKEKRENMRRK